MVSVADNEQWQEQKAKVDRFVARFGNESYRLLAYHAALPLVLTPELVNYLRNEFLRDKNVPWEAEVDLLLSDLCSQVSYELYAMDAQVRAYLLEEAQDHYPFWQQRMREVAQVLISYVNFLSRVNPERRQQELEAQRLAAMVYLGDEACQRAVQEIAERLKQVSDSAETGTLSERGVRAELARLTRITQELAPQLQQATTLVEYAKLVQRMLRNPEAVDPAELQQVHQVGNVALTVSPRIFPAGRQPEEQIEIPGFPPIEVLEFETAQLVEQEPAFPPLQTQTVEVATLSFYEFEDEIEDEEAPSEGRVFPVLVPFTFEVATIELVRSTKKPWGWKFKRRVERAELYEERLSDALSLEMVAIPSGRFIMGSPNDEPERSSSERPQHEVVIKDFYMGRYPVTQAQWRFVAELLQVNREFDPDPSHFKGDDRPVETVSWFDAVEFCARLNQYTAMEYRLPTEAEWEYACRAGTITPFHFGETISSELANYDGSPIYNGGPKGKHRGETTSVKQFGIANAFGLCDMHGNVYEWCEDHWHGNYSGASTDGSAWLTENENASRVRRGGSWNNIPRSCRSAYRNSDSPAYRNYRLGFRVVCCVSEMLPALPF